LKNLQLVFWRGPGDAKFEPVLAFFSDRTFFGIFSSENPPSKKVLKFWNRILAILENASFEKSATCFLERPWRC
jgi:hypothetical protein